MQGFLTALLLCAAAALLFANLQSESLLRDGPVTTSVATAEASTGAVPSSSLAALR
jgi:hypothetical protein